MELTPHLIKNDKVPVYMQLYQYIKFEIMKGRLNLEDPLPSIRNLSDYLGISKTTVENAYGQLLAEGYIYSKPQKGYFVSFSENLLRDGSSIKRALSVSIDSERPIKQYYEYDFKNEYVEAVNFDLNNWKKHLNTIINYHYNELYTYGDLQGEATLRNTILKYAYRTRGVNGQAGNIVVGAGVQPLLQILSSILKKQGIRQIAMEDPGFSRAKNVFFHNEFKMHPLEVTDKGIDIEQLVKCEARLCYVSPSHQFPTGTVMRIDARSRLIKWAQDRDAYIIEDDYNSELRYEGQPIPAMQGMDPNERVIYLGSFSTVLIPTIRLSFMLLPEVLMRSYLKDMDKYAQTASKLEQLALANMMETGDFERHIRKIRKNYSKKSEYTIKLVHQYLDSYIEITGINSGLNILLKLKFQCDETKLLQDLNEVGIHIALMYEHFMNPKLTGTTILVMSFRGIQKEAIEGGVRKMKDVFAKHVTFY